MKVKANCTLKTNSKKMKNIYNNQLKQKFALGIGMLATLVIGTVCLAFTINGKQKKEVKFKVVIENITDKTGVAVKYGVNNMFGLSPVVLRLPI
jgi:hypothetical protein